MGFSVSFDTYENPDDSVGISIYIGTVAHTTTETLCFYGIGWFSANIIIDSGEYSLAALNEKHITLSIEDCGGSSITLEATGEFALNGHFDQFSGRTGYYTDNQAVRNMFARVPTTTTTTTTVETSGTSSTVLFIIVGTVATCLSGVTLFLCYRCSLKRRSTLASVGERDKQVIGKESVQVGDYEGEAPPDCTDSVGNREPLPAYQDNESVEHYDEVAKQWFPGNIHVNMENSAFTYYVHSISNAPPEPATLDMLRKPFKVGEQCLYCSKLSSEWVPAVVVEVMPENPDESLYSVRALTGAATIHAQGAQLQPHFGGIGDRLEIYSGTKQGWIFADFANEVGPISESDAASIQCMMRDAGIDFQGSLQDALHYRIIRICTAEGKLKLIPTFLARHPE